MTPLLVALGAAAGASTRFLSAHHLDARTPWGTLLVNVVGSFLLGLWSGLALTGLTLALLGVGFCGGLTTWSALAVQSVERGRRGLGYAAGTVALALPACALGFWLGTA